MRIQRRDGGTVHHGHRDKAKGGYTLTCKRRLVPFADWKRTKKAVKCIYCRVVLANRRVEKEHCEIQVWMSRKGK